ncbi:hypothetical protein RFI_35716 [Reticulomyxa filosa]|uniref:Uncharacterized protein n=1 Tax=Reticulomyxa filosa TaxID=46433 RepID=X6LIC7_RETFI|nr:hypothetical protein RFI_35716 [Reticulomyxa filosa]|eukprot:ETO01723.1 hypothetical protein RFI_35716 [Reticulomyxa filosa]
MNIHVFIHECSHAFIYGSFFKENYLNFFKKKKLVLGLEDQEKTNTFKECYDKECTALLNEQAPLKSFQCLLCEQIAYNEIALTCNEHEDYQGALVIEKQCFK